MPASGMMRRLVAASPIACGLVGCTTIDPGPNFVVPDTSFDPDYFYCHVEPELIIAKRCGPGDPSQGDRPNGCHFDSAAVSGMALSDHPPIDCRGGDLPVDRSQIGPGSVARGDFEAVTLEMSRDYSTAALLVRPSGSNHPRAVIDRSDPQIIHLLQAWANK